MNDSKTPMGPNPPRDKSSEEDAPANLDSDDVAPTDPEPCPRPAARTECKLISSLVHAEVDRWRQVHERDAQRQRELTRRGVGVSVVLTVLGILGIGSGLMSFAAQALASNYAKPYQERLQDELDQINIKAKEAEQNATAAKKSSSSAAKLARTAETRSQEISEELDRARTAAANAAESASVEVRNTLARLVEEELGGQAVDQALGSIAEQLRADFSMTPLTVGQQVSEDRGSFSGSPNRAGILVASIGLMDGARHYVSAYVTPPGGQERRVGGCQGSCRLQVIDQPAAATSCSGNGLRVTVATPVQFLVLLVQRSGRRLLASA